MKLETLRHLAAFAVEDEHLSEEEERGPEQASTALELQSEDFIEALLPCGSRLVIACTAAGRLATLTHSCIVLKSNEVAHLEVAARLMKEVVHRETRGDYAGVSIPITKGVRFRTGSYRGRSVVVGTSLQEVDTGVLAITNRRAIFKGMRQSIEHQFSKLIGINVFDDGIQLHVSNRKNAALFRVDDGHLVAAVVNAVVQRD